MPVPIPRASALGNELTALTRDDRPRLDQILWSLEGDVRRDPNDLVAQIALCNALALGGDSDALRTRLQRVTPHLSALPGWLQLHILKLLISSGDFVASAAVVDVLIARSDLGSGDRSDLIDLATALALRSGDMSLLARMAGFTALDSAPSRAIKLLQAHKLEIWWRQQQAAIEAVIGPRTTHFNAYLQTDDDYGSRIIFDYYTDVSSFAALDELQAQADLVLEQVYENHPDGLSAMLDIVIIAIHRPFIPRLDFA